MLNNWLYAKYKYLFSLNIGLKLQPRAGAVNFSHYFPSTHIRNIHRHRRRWCFWCAAAIANGRASTGVLSGMASRAVMCHSLVIAASNKTDIVCWLRATIITALLASLSGARLTESNRRQDASSRDDNDPSD